MNLNTKRAATVLFIVVSGLGLAGCDKGPSKADLRLAAQGVPASDFVANVESGRQLFADNCAQCHGLGMRGTDQGPPLLHPYYKPDHHSDLAFFRAIKLGARAHHWNFGDMPAQSQLAPDDAGHIVAYVRERQTKVGLINGH